MTMRTQGYSIVLPHRGKTRPPVPLISDSVILSRYCSEYAGIPCRVAGRVPHGAGPGELRLEDHVTRADRRVMSLGACYSVVAAEEALRQAGWVAETEEQRCYTGELCVCLLEFYVLATSMVISGRVPSCDSAHSW